MADGRADEYLTLDKKRLFVDHISAGGSSIPSRSTRR